MNITHIRNATQIIDYAGKRFLIDPMLADKGAWPGFPGTARSELRNPLVELPFSRDKIVDVDAVIVTHTHDDHWDAAAIAAIPKTLPVFVQHEADAALLRSQGFQDLRLLSADSEFAGVRLLKTTSGQHGSDRTTRCRRWPNAWARPAAWCFAIRRRRRCGWWGILSGAMTLQPTC